MTTTREQVLAGVTTQQAADALSRLFPSQIKSLEAVAFSPIDYPELPAPELWILPESEELS